VGSVLTLALIAVGAAIPVPYVAEGPGVTFDTLGSVNGTEMISFTGDDIPASVDEKPSGHLNMTAISITDRLPLFAALGLWGKGSYALIPREDQFPPNKSVEQVNKENAQMFAESQSAAEISALTYLGYPQVLYVGNVIDNSPSAGKLEPQDRILSVNGTAVNDLKGLLTVMAGTKPGDAVELVVDRDGKKLTETITLGENPQDKTKGFLGIEPQQRPSAPFQVNITLDRIGGPSAGLMFTLGIIDKLTPGELTSGHFIAGTGEIQPYADASKSPAVGAIGGIVQKLITARDAGATVFLVPAPNCQEALTRVPSGLELVKVSTLDDAMAAMTDLKNGKTPAGC
jgi:PDZ domain-containing protein